MAEQERLTKAERREQKRQRRLEEEAAAAAKAARDRRRNTFTAIALLVVVGLLVWLAVGNLTPDASVQLTRAEAEEARAAADCEVLDPGLITDADTAPLGISSREHLDPATAPAAEVLYTNGRPTASGPHYTNPLPIVNGIRDEPIDERASTHNLEHGSIIVWFDADEVPSEDVADIEDWVTQLNENGFAENTGRAGIIASPVGESGIDSGKPLAIRAWGQAMDCESWDRDWANAFTIDHYGTNGTAPENFIGVYPEDTLAYGDGGDSTDETTDAPAEDAPAEDSSEPAASDEPTDEATE